ncbi:TolC family outer membrane protein [Ideonella sp. BN130291]|uniref:TolC family outer membrane protein n=1 Tax=Ideonella sp. BN130291 TaxID=3112940 RepID=UPI002E25B291|nr:TolC family outer membrane protein [Ideonella sp. BN130291]
MRPVLLKPLAAAALLLALGALPAAAQTAADDAMKAAAQKAIASNPEVSARLNQLRAAVDAMDIARAGLRPQVNLEASVGRDRDRITSRNPAVQGMERNGAALSLNQLLWDGGALQHELRRLGHDKLARYFELLDVTEQTALEAARAYQDVQRFRRLVELAEDNYVQHRYTLGQIQSRYKAGVGRGVDNEQVVARLALAESNLTTEVANLHDVTARYARIVGEAPPPKLPAVPSMAGALPASPGEAMATALRGNAAINAAIENLRAARELASERRSALQPRVEARLRGGGGHNFDGVADQRYDTTAQVVLNWSLYDGGANQARIRQQARLVDQAADQRDKACRDVRQNAAIAYNDTRKLAEQVEALDRNALAIQKARDAYRQQFDIGQRSLLDLLNAENELYTARRAHANALADLEVARLRTLATMQRLTAQLGLARLDVGPELDDAAGWDAGADVPARCPVLLTEVQTTPRSELDARAQSLVKSAPAPTPAK